MLKTSTAPTWFAITLLAITLTGCASAPPEAKAIPTQVTLGGQQVTDDYWWLRDKNNPAVAEYLNAENAYTDSAMKPTLPLQDRLYKEILARIRENDETVPRKDGHWFYSSKTEAGKQYPIYLRRDASPTAAPQILADVNQLAAGHKFFHYNAGPVSDDANLLAYATDTTGGREYTLRVKNLITEKILDDAIEQVDSFVWLADNKTLCYVKEDESKRGSHVYRHALGTPPADDTLIYEEKDEQFAIDLGRTRDKKFIVITAGSKTMSEVWVIPADASAPARLVEPRKPDFEYYLDHRLGRFYIRANDTSKNFRIVTAPDNDPSKKNWTELVAARPDIILNDVDCFAHHLVVSQRQAGLPQLAIAPLPENPDGLITPTQLTFDEPDYLVSLSENSEFDPPALRFIYTSLTTPKSVFDLDWKNNTKTLLKQEQVGGGFDRNNYREERLFAPAADGTKIPISLVYKKSASATTQPAPAPLLLCGYGSYGISNDVYFTSSRLSLLDRGVTVAIAHVRGGGEFGRAWYDAGRMQNKPNTFSDFIAAAEFLEKNNYTSPNQLAIEGGSAGGLLIGTVVNQRPDLFAAAIAYVPWVDVLADMSDPAIPLTTLEYTEWGNPNIPAQRAVIAAYCPYTNVRHQPYPKMLVRESLNDSEVSYWDATRWVAKLRAAKKKAGPAGASELLFKMDMDAGHGGASGRYHQLRETAFDDAWLLTRLGVEK